MTRYAAGDLQGCLTPLKCLLNDVDFSIQRDELWLVGDLINRGPESLETLEFLIALEQENPDNLHIVLGNHDLNFIAVAYGYGKVKKKDTIQPLLDSPRCEEFIEWLCQKPLFYMDQKRDYAMSHAGIPAIWSLEQAQSYADEVSTALKNKNSREKFFANMYGNQPDCWHNDLTGAERLRVITNYFTRMRFCTAEGKLDLENKTAESYDPFYEPWFAYRKSTRAKDTETSLLFGHWAALMGKTKRDDIIALDTGCVWGGDLTLMNLENGNCISCDCI